MPSSAVKYREQEKYVYEIIALSQWRGTQMLLDHQYLNASARETDVKKPKINSFHLSVCKSDETCALLQLARPELLQLPLQRINFPILSRVYKHFLITVIPEHSHHHNIGSIIKGFLSTLVSTIIAKNSWCDCGTSQIIIIRRKRKYNTS